MNNDQEKKSHELENIQCSLFGYRKYRISDYYDEWASTEKYKIDIVQRNGFFKKKFIENVEFEECVFFIEGMIEAVNSYIVDREIFKDNVELFINHVMSGINEFQYALWHNKESNHE